MQGQTFSRFPGGGEIFSAGGSVCGSGIGGRIPVHTAHDRAAGSEIYADRIGGEKMRFSGKGGRGTGTECEGSLHARGRCGAGEIDAGSVRCLLCARGGAAEHIERILYPVGKNGGAAKEEITEAQHALDVLGAREIASETFLLSGEAGERTLFVAEKVKPTPAAYPRGRGKERSKPL